jgi:hypothetical protein
MTPEDEHFVKAVTNWRKGNMEKPSELRGEDFPNTVWVPDGYDEKQIPVMSNENFMLLVEEHNKVVVLLNALAGEW